MWLHHLELSLHLRKVVYLYFNIYNLEYLVLDFFLIPFCISFNNQCLLMVYSYYHDLWVYINARYVLSPQLSSILLHRELVSSTPYEKNLQNQVCEIKPLRPCLGLQSNGWANFSMIRSFKLEVISSPSFNKIIYTNSSGRTNNTTTNSYIELLIFSLLYVKWSGPN